jgi:alpha-amylase
MINFSFNDQNSMDATASGMPAVGSINSTYADYAGKINTNDKFNVLTYLSSHDTRLCRNNLIWQGSAFQLLPGGIQIYYGDETNRPLAGGLAQGNDHALRADMNWNSIDQNVLAHWQKVGQFRNNHVAIGAGTHTSLTATSGAAFARNYNKGGVTDTAVACIGANANQSVTITLNGAFADGTTVKNAYDGTTATVTGGKVTFNSGSTGTILVESAAQAPTTEPTTEPTTVPPTTVPVPTTVPQPVYGDALVGDVDLNGKINIFDSTTLQLAVAGLIDLTDNQKKVADTNGDGNITIQDATNIQCYIVELKITGSKVGTTTQIEVPTTVPPTTEPPVTNPPVTNPPVTDPPVTNPPVTDPPVTDPPVSGQVKFTDNQNWGTVYAYFWGDSPDLAGAWPGTQMTWLQANEYGQNVYVVDIPSGAHSVVFTNNAGAQTVDISLGAEGYWTDGTMTDGKLNAFAWGDNPTPNPGPGPDPGPTPSGTIEFTDNQGWGKVFAYFWSDSQTDIGGGWPGQQMGNGYDNGFGQTNYSIAIPSGAMYVIFSNGNGAQTVDITLTGATGYYTDGSMSDGKYNVQSW